MRSVHEALHKIANHTANYDLQSFIARHLHKSESDPELHRLILGGAFHRNLALSTEEFKCLCDALKTDTQYTNIDFEINIPDEDFHFLVEALRENKTLTGIQFSKFLSESNIQLLNEVIVDNHILEHILSRETRVSARSYSLCEKYTRRNRVMKMVNDIKRLSEAGDTRNIFNYPSIDLLTLRRFVKEFKTYSQDELSDADKQQIAECEHIFSIIGRLKDDDIQSANRLLRFQVYTPEFTGLVQRWQQQVTANIRDMIANDPRAYALKILTNEMPDLSRGELNTIIRNSHALEVINLLSLARIPVIPQYGSALLSAANDIVLFLNSMRENDWLTVKMSTIVLDLYGSKKSPNLPDVNDPAWEAKLEQVVRDDCAFNEPFPLPTAALYSETPETDFHDIPGLKIKLNEDLAKIIALFPPFNLAGMSVPGKLETERARLSFERDVHHILGLLDDLIIMNHSEYDEHELSAKIGDVSDEEKIKTIEMMKKGLITPLAQHLLRKDYKQAQPMVANMMAIFEGAYNAVVHKVQSNALLKKEQQQKKEQHAATQIQTAVRGHQARKVHEGLKEEQQKKEQHAATQIQTAVRGHQARKVHEGLKAEKQQQKEQHATIQIQMAVRGYQARKVLEGLKAEQQQQKEQHATTQIQTAVRGYQARQVLDGLKKEKQQQKEQHAVTQIQTIIRGHQARKVHEGLKAQEQNELCAVIENTSFQQKLATVFNKRTRSKNTRHHEFVNALVLDLEREQNDVSTTNTPVTWSQWAFNHYDQQTIALQMHHAHALVAHLERLSSNQVALAEFTPLVIQLVAQMQFHAKQHTSWATWCSNLFRAHARESIKAETKALSTSALTRVANATQTIKTLEEKVALNEKLHDVIMQGEQQVRFQFFSKPRQADIAAAKYLLNQCSDKPEEASNQHLHVLTTSSWLQALYTDYQRLYPDECSVHITTTCIKEEVPLM